MSGFGLMSYRYHTVQEFNKGVYDYIIATDESGVHEQDTGDEEEQEVDTVEGCQYETTHLSLLLIYSNFVVISTQREVEVEETENPASTDANDAEDSDSEDAEPSSSSKRKRPVAPASTKSRKRKHRKSAAGDKEYGVTRGVDFVDVACVLNFDLPASSRSYTHRVGRTARAGRTGMSLSFVVPKDQWGKNKVVGCLSSAEKDESVFARIEHEQGARGSKIKEYHFNMRQVEAFRYRMEDALRSVTRAAIREARIKELKSEILNSDKLKVRFFTRYKHFYILRLCFFVILGPF